LNFPYTDVLSRHYTALSSMPSSLSGYLLPLAHKRRVLFMMDPAEAAYIIELRSRSAGHFSYRNTAWKMYEALRRQAPQWAEFIRVTPPEAYDPFER
ncbi:MAG: FAD-dependent thymidylate synthase, partial [Firmicutes bacterium]|nr:FAD-dependent thymidylate synthase [Bacillota bacterium]